MVFPDISSQPRKSLESSPWYLPTVADRVLAFVIDAFLFVPVVLLLTAGQLRDVKDYTLQNEDSPEATIVWLLLVFSILGFSIFLQSLFTYFWAASPGQKILNLQVVSLTPEKDPRITFPQAVLRSIFWWVSSLSFGIPFLEVLSHPQRRCFHDKASDTLLVSRVPTHDDGPSRMERQFVASWLRMVFLGIIVFGSLYFMKIQQSVKKGLFSREEMEQRGDLCRADISKDISVAQRLDILLSMHLLEESDGECLERESEMALWSKDLQDKPAAYLVKVALQKDREKKQEYQGYLCEKFGKSEECELARFMTEATPRENSVKKLKLKGMSLVTSRTLILQDSLKNKNLISAAAIIEDLMRDKSLQPYLQKLYVRMAWQMRDGEKAARTPANAETQEILKIFRKRYEIP